MHIRVAAAETAPLALLKLADPSCDRVQRYLEKGIVFLGEERGEVVAVAVLERNDGDFELRNIAVAERHQGRGLGRQLLEHVLGYAAKAGGSHVTVGTGNSSLRSLAFYQHAGFRVTGVVPGFFEAYNPPIMENGIRCRDMIRLTRDLGGSTRNPASAKKPRR